MKGLAGKVAIVTGGATLIGAAVVEHLRAAGAKVAVFDIDVAGGERLAAEGGDALAFWPLDITDDAQIEQGVAAVNARFGGVHLLVNLACTYLDDGAQSGRADWQTALNVNVVSAVMLARAVRPLMQAANGGAIVNFTSISSSVAQTGRWLYPVSKAALLQVTRSLAMDFAADRIRVNSVSPGWTWSRVIGELAGGNRDKADRVAASYHLLGRLGLAGVLAEAPLVLGAEAPEVREAPLQRNPGDTDGCAAGHQVGTHSIQAQIAQIVHRARAAEFLETGIETAQAAARHVG